MNELLDDIPYGAILCDKDGGMLYANLAASKLINCESGSLTDCNIRSYIDQSFASKMTELFNNIANDKDLASNFIYVKTKDTANKFYKLVAKKSDKHQDKLILMIYDYTPIKLQQDSLSESYNHMSDNLIRNSLVLKVIADICSNVLYKDRSTLSDIVLKLAFGFHLEKAAICFKNGTGHVIYAKRKSDKTYETGRIDGDSIKKECPLWKNENNYIDCKQLIFKIPMVATCCSNEYSDDVILNVLKLKLNSQKVIGFFEFIEDKHFKLSDTELEVLESLSQLLAYIINNKEQVNDTTNYIREKFKSLT